MKKIFIETKRLILRQWLQEDEMAFAKLNANPEVMQYFPSVLSPKESNSRIRYFRALLIQHGWGIWAVERKEDQAFLGSAGIMVPVASYPLRNCVEIGWRLDRPYWKKGYATEAALGVLKFAFADLGLPEIVAFSDVRNINSQAVMKRIGMLNTHRNFWHKDPQGEKRQYCLYAINQEMWEENQTKEQKDL